MKYSKITKELNNKQSEFYQQIQDDINDGEDWIWIGDGWDAKEKCEQIVSHVMYQKFTNYSPTIFSFFLPTLLFSPFLILSNHEWDIKLMLLLFVQILLPFILMISKDNKIEKYMNNNIRIINKHYYISRYVAIQYLHGQNKTIKF